MLGNVFSAAAAAAVVAAIVDVPSSVHADMRRISGYN